MSDKNNPVDSSQKLDTKDVHPVKQQLETGITSTVTTAYSSLSMWDIIKIIADKKSEAVNKWINSISTPVNRPVIAGTYLTGASLAQKLIKRNEIKEIEVLDIYSHLSQLLNTNWKIESEYVPINKNNNIKNNSENNIDKIFFSTNLDHLKTGDMIIDTTGLGGLDVNQIKELKSFKVFLAEDPSSDGSDDLIQSKNFTQQRLEASSAIHRGRVFTSGLGSKTSGTMTLTLDVLRKSVEEVLKKEGVLYAVASLDFYEGILFKEKNVEKFLETLQRPAMVASSLEPIDLDSILKQQMEKITVDIIEYIGED
jgi:hypothetical protein